MTKTSRLRRSLLGCLIGCMGVVGFGGVPAFALPYSLLTTIGIPTTGSNTTGGRLTSFDISYFDGNTQNYYLADRSNNTVDVLSAATNSLVTQFGTGTFSGALSSPDISGPNGVMVANNQVWVGNGDSTVHVYNVSGSTYTLATSVSTSLVSATATKRADEMAVDPTDHVAIVANDAATPSPYLNFINTTTHAVTSQLVLDGSGTTPNATGGIEQPVWMPSNDKFYVSIPQIGGSGPGGIAEIDPTTGQVIKIYDLAGFGISGCGPTGLVKGSGNQLLIGCGTAGTQTILFDPTANGGSGNVVAKFGFSGSDEVAFDPTNSLYFVTASSSGQLGIIDGLTNTFLGSLTTATGAHSVAVDPVSGEVFVPLGAGAGNTICPGGCVAVYAAPEPTSIALLAVGVAGLAGMIALDRRSRRSVRC